MFSYECVGQADWGWPSSILSYPHRASLRWRRMGASAPYGACVTVMGQSPSLPAAYITTYITNGVSFLKTTQGV
jgi:hypothetical protein